MRVQENLLEKFYMQVEKQDFLSIYNSLKDKEQESEK